MSKLIFFLRLVVIEASKEGVKFSCQGDIGNGSVTIRQHTNVDKPDQNVSIDLSEPVALTFSLKYLVNFCKASNLSSSVKLHLSQEVPLLVEYGLGSGHLRFYLAPKVQQPRTRQCLQTILIRFYNRSVMRSKGHDLVSPENTKRRPYDNGKPLTVAMNSLFVRCVPGIERMAYFFQRLFRNITVRAV